MKNRNQLRLLWFFLFTDSLNMDKLKDIVIPPLSFELDGDITYKLNQKTKPVGSLGLVERLARRVALIQGSLTPSLNYPVMLTVASDHKICDEGVSPCPTEITWQQCLNFMNGGGGIGLFCSEFGFDHYVVDAGVDYDFSPNPRLIDAKVRRGTRNFLHQPAMTDSECMTAINNGRRIVAEFHAKGCNIIGFGEMGIGNTSPASALLSVYTGLPLEKAVGPGSGLSAQGVNHKLDVIKRAIDKHGISDDGFTNLARFGGLEIATICGGMIEAASRRMVVLTDGFITTAAVLAADAIVPGVKDYVIFSHQSMEQGHRYMIEFLGGEPVLHLDFRLGEGTGAAAAYPIVKCAVAVLNKMTSFDETGVFNTAGK